jgi:DNA-binding beta-propeller fold protein YncE
MTTVRATALACLAAAIAFPAAIASQPRPADKAVAGTGTMYVGTYKGTIAVLDEATEKVVGEIPLKSGIPGNIRFSDDRNRMYVRDTTYEKIEIVDRVKRDSIDTITLSKGRTKTRIQPVQPDPHDQYLIFVAKDYTKQVDRWEIGPPRLVQFDLKSKSITRTIPWPKGEERDFASVLFSPDGKLMYLFGDDVLIYETENFTEVDKWDLSQPLEEGAGRVTFGGLDPFSDAPGFYTGFFTMQDPLQNRRIMGIGRIELAKKKIEFHPIGPSRGLSFSVSPDHKRGYGLFSDIGEYEFWTFDLESYRLTSRTPFRGRPRMSMRVSSGGNVLYIYTAGNTIDLYDSTSLKYLRTITLDGDMTSFTLLPPPRGTPTAAAR